MLDISTENLTETHMVGLIVRHELYASIGKYAQESRRMPLEETPHSCLSIDLTPSTKCTTP